MPFMRLAHEPIRYAWLERRLRELQVGLSFQESFHKSARNLIFSSDSSHQVSFHLILQDA